MVKSTTYYAALYALCECALKICICYSFSNYLKACFIRIEMVSQEAQWLFYFLSSRRPGFELPELMHTLVPFSG